MKWSSKEWLEKLTPEDMEEIEKQFANLFDSGDSKIGTMGDSDDEDDQDKLVKVTTYLPAALERRLDEAWMASRLLIGKKVKKAQLFQGALEIYLHILENFFRSRRDDK